MTEDIVVEDISSEELVSIEHAREAFDDAQLIDYILERFHERHRTQLENLVKLAAKVESVHGDDQLCPNGLTLHLTNMRQELEQHMFKEENILFPMIKAGQGAMAVGPISVMKHEHEEHAAAIKALETRANNLVLPAQACHTWQNLYQSIEAFITDLKAHIELENDVLFARQV